MACAVASLSATTSDAQQRPGKRTPVEAPRGRAVPVAPLSSSASSSTAKAEDAKSSALPESVEADVSTRNVAVTSSFTGTEIVVFGSIHNSRQTSAESGVYDVVVVVEGIPGKVTARKKDRVGGIWLNTRSATFEEVPSYYAIASTRPLDEIASEATLIGYELGFDHVRMTPAALSNVTKPATAKDAKDKAAPQPEQRLPAAELRDFRNSVIRLKKKDGLYVQEDYSVAFIGKSLFRAAVALPANVPVGPFETRVYLFRQERLLSQYNVRIKMEREGLERLTHSFAHEKPLAYGLLTVLLAMLAGLAASTIFSKSSH
ncbi:MAG: TIGR02186 family protein [Hyphomicrobiaceae bacterium]|nr:TIGR02186 family protein [Hyphomicrobiaceae bacterium]